jgi:hypothetical protein
MLVIKEQPTKDIKRKSSLSATWQAIMSLPTDHFPLILPGVHRIAVFFILRRLKRLGFSACRVDDSGKGLVVYAQR